ncbi:MAG: SDR family NAD(P)-dependent oxidoreductase [Candidatus Promineifilaceae bacterium]|nr:SDR family NAD(P)-dependent oxidoreductase [Candidatus Promineifilaceae bacterium]
MKNKVCVVTGGNRGIGFEIVTALANQGAHVVLTSRDKKRGEAAVRQLQREPFPGMITLVVGDLGTINDTRDLAHALLNTVDRIDVLINNAGVWPTKKVINRDGLEEAFMVNFLAPFMLSHLLKECLVASAPARIVHVNAGLYVKGKVDLGKTPYGKNFSRIRTYADSKLCGVLTLDQEAAMYAPHEVTVNMVHPGVVNTDLGQMAGPLGWLLKLVKRSWMTPEQGAVAPVWLATAAEVADKTGLYFNEKEILPVDNVAKNKELARDLWRFALREADLDTS